MRAFVAALLLMVTPAVLAGYFQHFDQFRHVKDEDVIDCLAEDKLDRCSDVLRDIREKFDSIMSTNCEKCDPDERDEFLAYVAGFTHRHPEVSKKVQDRYDPDRVYRKKFGDFWTKRGIVLY